MNVLALSNVAVADGVARVLRRAGLGRWQCDPLREPSELSLDKVR